MLNLPKPTEYVISRVFIESSVLEQGVAIHPGMDAERVGIVKSQAKPEEVYSLKVMSGGENASQVAEMVNGVYGTDNEIANYVQCWFHRFLSGIFEVKVALTHHESKCR
ncbi:hypothetical protein TNCV_197731 [Trichonephila clavipes]|nr:hypothetical protein TNCV_197731 [Trichonephila clavipes]